MWPKVNLNLFGPLFGPLGTIIGIFWVWPMGQTGQPGCPLCRFSLVPALFYYLVVTFGVNHENASFGSFWALGGPKYVQCSVLKLEQRSAHIVGPEKTIDNSNGALSLNAYHISHYKMSELTKGFCT